MTIDESTIIRYLNNELPANERELFMKEVRENETSRKLFIHCKNIWVLNRAVNVSGRPEKQYETFRKTLADRRKQKVLRILNYCRNAAALFTIPLVIAIVFLSRNVQDQNEGVAVVQTISTPMGVKGHISLPDGTQVWLNSGTKLSYPSVFAGKQRIVKLEGEAYFEVRKDTSCPFRVEMKNEMRVTVLGTSFNVSCYENDPAVETTLVEGKVVFRGNGQETVMKPSENISFSKEQGTVLRREVDPGLYTSWKENKLMFRNAPMEEVIRKMERWYGVTIYVENARVYNYYITATFNGENLTQVLDLLRISSPMQYRIDTNKVYLK